MGFSALRKWQLSSRSSTGVTGRVTGSGSGERIHVRAEYIKQGSN